MSDNQNPVVLRVRSLPVERHCLECGGVITLSGGHWVHRDPEDRIGAAHLAQAGCEDCGAPEPLDAYHQCPPEWTI